MKRLVLLVSLALLTVVGTTATTQAYYLDTPHNESNGIYCATCHNSAEFRTSRARTGIDDTRYNAVCLQCHGETPTMPSFKGPVKKLHASSSTSTTFGTWTTQCTQCHDVHFQGQLDWAADASLYLATGTIAADNAPYNTVSKSTTVAINAPVANPLGSGWDDTTKWTTKGGNVVVGAATTDGTRGLIFVPNKNNPTETFEIIAATPTSVTVKGKMTTALSGNAYGVIYGQSLKSYMLPNNGATVGTTVDDLRAVKFFRPEVVGGTYGGYVDESGNPKPEGLCQVCHTDPAMVWKKDGTANTHHVGEKCGTCHNSPAGFPPAKDHSTFIIDGTTYPCVGCHATKVANPDSGHVGGCGVCHTATKPEINDIAMTNDGANVGSSLDKLVAASYSGGTTGSRLLDASSRDINNASFTKIKCDVCHVSRAVFHAGHDNTTFAWAGNCSDCHSGTGIVANVHSDNCILCHVNGDGTGGRKIGDATNGIDGHANGEVSTATCLDCHDDNTPGTIHHNRATADNCATSCHKVSTTGGTTPANHAGNHTALVNTDPNCSTCHAANEGGVNGAPVDGAVTPNMIHDKCTSCHNTTGVLKTAVEVGGTKVTDMPNGGAGSTNGGGACGACHGVYFTSHDHSHAATVTSVALCGACHTVTDTIVDTHLNNCAGCHNTTSGARIGSATASPTGGVCTACHTTYFTGHSHNHTFTATAACATCHGNNVVGSNAKDAVADPYTTAGEVHGTAACATCHNIGNNTGALYGSATGKAAATECVSCHVDTWTVTHTGATGLLHTEGRVGATTGSCDTCHGAPTPGTSDARDAQTTPYIGTGEVHGTASCATCHTGANNGGLKTGPLTHAETVAKGTCTTCHTNADWTSVHSAATVSHNITTTPLCATTCHSSASMVAVVHNNNCANCHNLSTGARVNGAANAASKLGTTNVGDATVNGGAGGACADCHVAYFPLHKWTHSFTVTPACSGCHGNPTSSGSGRTAKTAPYTGTGEVHATISCGGCHNLATDGTKISLAIGKLNTASCSDCHGAVWQTIHAAATVNHGTVVNGTDAACNVCHATNTVAGSNARKLGTTSPYMAASGDIHYTNGCATCHNSDGSMRSSGLTKADRVGTGGNCTYCHANTSTWTTIHTAAAIDHTAEVALGVSICGDCHTATAGNPTVPVNASDNKVHDSCVTCHEATGSLKTFAVADTHNPNWIAAMPANGGDCAACHGSSYFGSHQVIPHTEFVYDVTGVTNAKDVVQTGTNSPCATCHNDSANSLATFNDKYVEHLSNCDKCHLETRDINETTASGTNVRQWIAARTADTTETNCRTCHVPNWTNVPAHDGHATTDFPWDATTQTSCGTVGCHDYLANPDVVVNIHGGTCTMCHSSASGGDGTSKVGSATNGVDGDATLGSTASPHNDNCLVCHNIADVDVNADSIGGIHHDNKSGNVTCTTSNCHLASYLTHTTSVTAVALCTNCHNGATAGGATTGATTVPYIAAGQVHNLNGCTTCHLIAGAPGKGGGLVGTTAKSLGLSNNGTATWTNGTDGGGSCTTCHSSVNTTYGFLHHDLGEARGNNCTATCHTTTFGVANHSTSITNATTPGTVYATGCVTCHTSANIVGTATGAPVNPASGLVHDACRTCHTFDASNYGILVTSGGAAKKGIPASFTLPNNGTIGGTDGGGTCILCHTGMNTDVLSAGVHHTDSAGHTNIGECEYCHADPRAGSQAASGDNGNFQEVMAITPPKHMPCEDCHVTPKSTGIATGNSWANPMTILSFNEAYDTQKSMSTWAADYTRATANTGGHSIANSSGKINNWGICFNCHNSTRAIKVDVLHAAPLLYKATNASVSSGWGTFLPGRAVSSTLANFNFLVSSFRPTATVPGITGGRGDTWVAMYASSVKYNLQPYDGGTASDMTIPDPYSTASTIVPMYPDRVAESTVTPAADNVQVISAVYSGGSVVVTGTTSAADCETNTLTVTYKQNGTVSNGTPCALIGTKPNCSCSVTGATAPTLGTSIVDVVTANTEGINVLGFYVK